MHRSYWLPLAVAATLVWSGTATAYVGPGAGISLVGSLFGLISAVVIAVGVVLLWPIRRLMRRFKGDGQPDETSETQAERSE